MENTPILFDESEFDLMHNRLLKPKLVSIAYAFDPTRFVRHQDDRLRIHGRFTTEVWRKDSTFIIEPHPQNPDGIVFRSVWDHNQRIRHMSHTLHMTSKLKNPTSFEDDSLFFIDNSVFDDWPKKFTILAGKMPNDNREFRWRFGRDHQPKNPNVMDVSVTSDLDKIGFRFIAPHHK